MILDEATASMDLDTEDTIRKIFNEYFHNITMLIIAHRISTVMNCNRILVLNNGEIAEFDTPNNLKKNTESLFSKLISDSPINSDTK